MALIHSCQFEGETAVSCLIQGIENGMVRNTAGAGKYRQAEQLFAYLGALVDGPSGTGTQSQLQKNVKRQRLVPDKTKWQEI